MQIRFKTYLKYLFLLILLCGSFQVKASIIDGTINSTNRNAQTCENAPCSITSTSPVNFGYFTDPLTVPFNVHVTDTALTGLIWGESFGWAVLNCVNTIAPGAPGGLPGGGCTTTGGSSGHGNGAFHVSNDHNGNLSGWAWGEDSGWINFNSKANCDVDNNGFIDTGCGGDNTTTAVVDFKVTINNSGQFLGYAWSENHGYIKFDCGSGVNYCVQTDWRPQNSRPQCSDGIDNDSDGSIDSLDSGCINNGVYDPTDDLEYVSTSPGGCTVNCNPPPFCTLHPTDPSCQPPTFCSLHPTDPICITPTFCSLHPNDPSCVAPTFCSLHPTDPTCNPNPSFCTLHPTDPSCIPPPPCVGPNCNPPPPCIGAGCIAPPPIKKTIDSISGILDIPKVSVVSKAIVSVGALSGIILSFSTVLFANPLTFSELFLIPIRLWSLLLSALGLKKRNRPWGIVYDSVTKQPLDPAYVILQDLSGHEITTSITDLDGRYGFLVPAGQYRMIAHKTNYEFPSRKLAGKSSDELHDNLYFNEIITVAEGEVVTKNIPMDSLTFDWNEFAKKDQGLMKFYSKRDVLFTRLSNILFYFGFIITTLAIIVAPKFYNIITFAVYVLLFILKHTVLKPRPFGRLVYKDSNIPLSFAIIHVYSASIDHEIIRKVSDKTGKYYCLIPNGSYYVKIEAKNQDTSYTLVYISPIFDVKNGYINQKFKV